MAHDNRPIDPGPEPDTTDAAAATTADEREEGTRIDPEDAPDILDEGDDHVDETFV